MHKTRMGWCPRTGNGQRLMFMEAVSEYIWLATCQGKIYKNNPPPPLQCTRLFNSASVTLLRVPYVQSGHVRGVFWGKI